MGIPLDQFQPETFAQANPMMTGLQYGAQTVQDLVNAQIAAQYANPMAAAQLQQAQAQPALTQAQTNYYGQGLTPAAQADAAANQARAQQIQFMTQNPQYLAGGLAAQIAAVNGMSTNGNGSGAQPSSNGNPQFQNGAQVLGASLPPQGAQYTNPSGLPTMPGGLTSAPNVPMPSANNGGSNPIQNYQAILANQKGLMAQATSNVAQYNKMQDAANTAATTANQVSQYADEFQKNYGDSTFTGPLAGKVKTTGWESAPAAAFKAITGEGDLTPEQLTDNASQNMAAAVAKLIAGGRVTNNELAFVQTMKPNRAMTSQAAQQASSFLKEYALKQQEEPPFLNAARSLGVPPQTASTLWNAYRTQRPVMNFQTGKPNTQYRNTYSDYLTPTTITQATYGQPITPLPVASSLQKAGMMPNSGNYSATDLSYTAQKYGMTVDQVRQKLAQQSGGA